MSEDVMVRHPYWSLAAAAGAGYLVGGGFPPRRLVGFLLAASGQMVMTAVLRELVPGQVDGPSASPSMIARTETGAADAGKPGELPSAEK